MEQKPKSKLERVRFEKIRHVSVFINSIMFCSMHEHSALELAIVLRGQAKIRRDQEQFSVKPGDIILYNSYEPHEIAAEGAEPVSTLCIQISDRFCKDYYLKLPNLVFQANRVATLPAADRQKLHDLAFGAARDYFRERPGYQLACIGRISTLLALLMEKLPYTVSTDAEYTAQQSKTARMRRIVSYIDQHYREKITLADLAQQEGITATHLSHFFTEAFHVSFREYLNAVRLEKALVLMKDPSLYLVDICMESGFSDSRYLNAVFEKAFGCSAMKYREEYLASGADHERPVKRMPYSSFRYTPSQCLEILAEHEAKGGFQYV